MIEDDNLRINTNQPSLHMPVLEDFRYHDALPRGLRFAITEAHQKLTSFAVAGLNNICSSASIVRLIYEQECIEIDRYATEYYKKYKRHYPHVAAGASIQRYSSGVPRKRRSVNYPMSVPDTIRWLRRKQ